MYLTISFSVLPKGGSHVWQTDLEEKSSFSDREAYTHTSEGGNGDRKRNTILMEENRRFSTLVLLNFLKEKNEVQGLCLIPHHFVFDYAKRRCLEANGFGGEIVG